MAQVIEHACVDVSILVDVLVDGLVDEVVDHEEAVVGYAGKCEKCFGTYAKYFVLREGRRGARGVGEDYAGVAGCYGDGVCAEFDGLDDVFDWLDLTLGVEEAHVVVIGV